MLSENRQNLPPGYTGHLPFRNETIGLTNGEALKNQLQTYEITKGGGNNMLNITAQMMMNISSNNNTSRAPEALDPRRFYLQEKYKSIGNQSRNATTWIGGPRHDIRDQRIPGYTGFLPGINSENLYGKSYTKCAAASLNDKINKGFDLSAEKRYQSQQQKAFSKKNFRRIVDRPELALKKDFLEYTMTLNQKEMGTRNKVLEKTFTTGNTSTTNLTKGMEEKNSYRSPRSNSVMYYDPNDSMISPPKSKRFESNSFYGLGNEVQIKPILLEKKLAEKEQFQKLSEGFKKIFADDDELAHSDIVIPIAGYTGHRKGSIAENLFGKSYRNVALESKRIERENSQSKSQYVRS